MSTSTVDLSEDFAVEESHFGGVPSTQSDPMVGDDDDDADANDLFIEDSFLGEVPNSIPSDVDHSSDNRLEPGMVFSSVNSLFKSYQEHARLLGFSVVKRTENRRYIRMVCDRSGTSKAQKSSKRIGCKARLNGKKMYDSGKQVDGTCMITSIFNEHTHDLDPSYSILMPTHRQLTVNMKRQLEANDIAGLRPCKNVRLLEVHSGGPMNLGCIPKDCTNFIEQRRRMRLGEGDAEAIRNMLGRIQLKDPNFSHLMDLDSDSRLRNVLWIHPRGRAAYEDFHDVVSFDTTYLVNRYNMSFASVVGVNHHGHSILLGCALVSHEDADSFRWLFRNWLAAMNGVAPTAIITDQCDSIRKAIRELMPDTIHRYCIWHILTKLPTKLKGVANYNDCNVELKGIVYDSLDIQTFESKWALFLEKYNLTNNAWLRELYHERENWVPVYLNHTFWAGMISTQRSESMHAYFDEFLHSRNTLKQFMEQYDMAFANKIQKEFHADYDSNMKEIKCLTSFRWEKQFQKAYTNSIFSLVQVQVQRMFYCHVLEIIEEGAGDVLEGIKKFNVLERSILNNFYQKEYTYTVELRSNGSYISCNCRKFEFRGILCCHIMKVLAQEDIQTVNARYILDRWKKTIHRAHSIIFFGGGYPHMTEAYKRYQEVEKYFQDTMVATMANEERMAYVKARCIEMKDDMLNWDEASRASNNVDASVVAGSTPLLDPHVVNRKGRPVGRHLSAMETSTRRSGGRGRGQTTQRRGEERGKEEHYGFGGLSRAGQLVYQKFISKL